MLTTSKSRRNIFSQNPAYSMLSNNTTSNRFTGNDPVVFRGTASAAKEAEEINLNAQRMTEEIEGLQASIKQTVD